MKHRTPGVWARQRAATVNMAYVDLNPIRASIAPTPEYSDFMSAQERIADLKMADEVSTADAKDVRIEHGEKARWLAPVKLKPKGKKVLEKSSSRRASSKGCVCMTLTESLGLLDWNGRQLKAGKRGAIAKKFLPILDQLNLSTELWVHAIEQFGKRRAANRITPASDSRHAAERKVHIEPEALADLKAGNRLA